MIKSALLLLAAAALSSAQLAHVPQRARTDGKVVPSSDGAFGRQKSNLRSNERQQRMLDEGSMSMSMTFGDVDSSPPAPPRLQMVCGGGEECPEGYTCQCRLGCHFCPAWGAAFCGTCVLDESE